jgi:hypothetical protein
MTLMMTARGRRLLRLGLLLSLPLAGCERWVTQAPLYSSVEVQATRRNGDPIADVALVLYTGQRPVDYGTTGADGRHRFERVPQGLYGVIARPPAGYDVVENLIGGVETTIVDGLVVALDTLSPVRFTFLKRGPGTVNARLTTAAGAPLEDVPVTLYSPAGTVAEAKTDGAGRVTFAAVPFGVYGIVAQRPMLYQSFARTSDSLYVYRDNILVDDGSVESVDVTLPRCAGAIEATVTDQSGTPVSGIPVTIYTATGILRNDSTTASGRQRVDDVPCALQAGVRIDPPLGYSVTEGRGSSFIDGLVLAADGQVARADFVIQRCTATIIATVRDNQGAAVAGARVAFYTPGLLLAEPVTGADGRVTLADAPCNVDLGARVIPPTGYTVTEGRGSSWFDGIRLTQGATTSLTFVLRRVR